MLPNRYEDLKTHDLYRPAIEVLENGDDKYIHLTFLMEQVWSLDIQGVTVRSSLGARAALWERYKSARGSVDKEKFTSSEEQHAEAMKQMPRRLDMSFYESFYEAFEGTCYGISLRWLDLKAQGSDLPQVDMRFPDAPADFPRVTKCTTVANIVMEYHARQSASLSRQINWKVGQAYNVFPQDLHTLAGRVQYAIVSSPLHAMALCHQPPYYYFLDPNHGCFKFTKRHLPRLRLIANQVWSKNKLGGSCDLVSLVPG